MNLKLKKLSWNTPLIILCLGVLLPLFTNILWLRINRIPPGWDDSAFLAHSLNLYDAFCEHGLSGFYSQYLKTLSWKGPIVAVQAVPMFMIFGRSIRIAPMINSLYLLIFSIYLYNFCRLYWNRTIAALAVLFSNMCPLLYGLANWYLRDYSYAMLMTMTAWHLVKSDGLRNMKQNAILGILLGVGVLHRDIYPLYAFPLYLVVLLPRFKRLSPSPEMAGEWVRFGVDCVVILGLALAIAFHWYWVNFNSIFAHSFGAAFGEDAKNYGSVHVFAPSVFLPYLRDWMVHCVSTWQFLLLIAAGAGTVVALKRQRVRPAELFPREGVLLVAAWFAPFFIFLFSVNKDIRFTSPLLPAFGIALAVLVWGAMQVGRRTEIAFWVLIVPSLWTHVFSLFGVGAPGFVKRSTFVQQYFEPKSYVYHPDPAYWPIRDLMCYIHNLDLSPTADKAMIMVLNSTKTFNNDTLQLMATLEKLPFTVTGGGDTNLERLRNWMGSMDYIVVSEGGTADAASIANPGPKMFQELLKEGIFVPVECPFRMPDGGKVRLWRRHRPEGSAVVTREWCEKEGLARHEVKYGEVATLRGLSAKFQDNTVTVQSAWVPDTAFWRQYDFFIHVLGPDGKTVLYNGDHAPQIDKLEPCHYVPGGLVYDCKVMNLGENPPTPTKVKLGLVHRTEKTRVSVAASDLPVIEEHSAVLGEITITTASAVAAAATPTTPTTPEKASTPHTLVANTLAYFTDEAYLNGVELKIAAGRLTLVTRWHPFTDFWNTHKIFCHVMDDTGNVWNLDHPLTGDENFSIYANNGNDYTDTYSIDIADPKGRFSKLELGLFGKSNEARVMIKSDRLKTIDEGSALAIPITDKGGVALKP